MFGWKAKVLHIDLTNGTKHVEHPPEEILQRFVGGKGLAGWHLRPWITRPWDDPQMPLLFFTGPLVDTPSPTSGRMCIMSRSPLTGTVGDCSVGGTLGPAIKRAGYDGIVITGKAPHLQGIEIHGDTTAFTDARSFRGAGTEAMRAGLAGKGASAVIGPAAENGVLFADIIVDGHFAAGRNGLGLVMASKNLKYMTIQGTEKTAVHDRPALLKAREDIFRLVAASPILLGEQGIANYGTPALFDLMDSRRMMPTDNFRKTHFDDARSMNAYAYNREFSPVKTGCHGCHIQCKKKSRTGTAMPEFETMSHFSALVGNRDRAAVVEANRVCNDMGMDTISAAVTLAAYRELTGRSLAPRAIVELLVDTAHRRGEGRLLAEGAARYCAAHGAPDSAMTVKSQELPAYDPRGAYGMALGYALSTRGGCHLRAYPISHEILRKPVATDRFSFDGKARIIKIAEDANAVIDSLTACKFLFFAASLEEFAKVFTAVTGRVSSAHDLLRAGERIYYHDRIMNAACGFSATDDDLPRRFFEQPGTSGNAINVPPLSRTDFLTTRAKYYRIRGLTENGLPTPEKAAALELKWNR